jgi:hypothetical protein
MRALYLKTPPHCGVFSMEEDAEEVLKAELVHILDVKVGDAPSESPKPINSNSSSNNAYGIPVSFSPVKKKSSQKNVWDSKVVPSSSVQNVQEQPTPVPPMVTPSTTLSDNTYGVPVRYSPNKKKPALQKKTGSSAYVCEIPNIKSEYVFDSYW